MLEIGVNPQFHGKWQKTLSTMVCLLREDKTQYQHCLGDNLLLFLFQSLVSPCFCNPPSYGYQRLDSWSIQDLHIFGGIVDIKYYISFRCTT